MAYNSKKSTDQINVDDMILNGVLTLVNNEPQNFWQGTMTELKTNLTKLVGKRLASYLPGSPSSLRIVINRMVNRLRNRKVSVKFKRTSDHMRTRLVRFGR